MTKSKQELKTSNLFLNKQTNLIEACKSACKLTCELFQSVSPMGPILGNNTDFMATFLQ